MYLVQWFHYFILQWSFFNTVFNTYFYVKWVIYPKTFWKSKSAQYFSNPSFKAGVTLSDIPRAVVFPRRNFRNLEIYIFKYYWTNYRGISTHIFILQKVRCRISVSVISALDSTNTIGLISKLFLCHT